MSLIRTLTGFIIAILLTIFAIFNRNTASIFLSPGHPAFDVPLYLIALGFMGTGFIIGSIFTWMNAAPVRKVKRKQRKTIKNLEKELSTMKTTEGQNTPPSSEFFPALPIVKNT